jgi:hypothetical protein
MSESGMKDIGPISGEYVLDRDHSAATEETRLTPPANPPAIEGNDLFSRIAKTIRGLNHNKPKTETNPTVQSPKSTVGK